MIAKRGKAQPLVPAGWKLIVMGGAMTIALLMTGCLYRQQPPISNNSFVNDLVVTMWINNPCVQPGDTVHLRATVANEGSQTEVVDLKDKPVLDIEIFLDKETVRWSNGKPLSPELTHLELKSGESKTIEMDWIVSNDNGFHNAYANFVYSDQPPIVVSHPGVPLNIGYCSGG